MNKQMHNIRRIYETQVEHNYREITLAVGLFEDLLKEAEQAEALRDIIRSMQSEINESFNVNKDKEVKRHYLNNAIRLGDRGLKDG